MTQQEHEAQRHLVALSLLLHPVGQHPAKGHETSDHDPHDLRH